jgi:hypothetical protein
VFFRETTRGDRWHTLAIIKTERTECGPAQCVCFFQYRFEHRHEVARRRVDNPEHLSGRGLLPQSLVTLGLAFGKFSLTLGKLTFEIGYPLLGIG